MERISGPGLSAICLQSIIYLVDWSNGFIPPDCLVHKHRGSITSPSRTIPTDTLTKEGRATLQCSGQLRFRSALDFDLPAMVDQPSGQAVVIVRLGQGDFAEEPGLVSEGIQKGFLL